MEIRPEPCPTKEAHMANPPPYPDTGNDTGAGPDRDKEPATTGKWAGRLVIALVAALVVVILILHLTGVVGPGAH
jgi:hypothetical protein